MRYKCIKSTVFVMVFTLLSCGNGKTQTSDDIKTNITPDYETETKASKPNNNSRRPLSVNVGANRTDLYLPALKDKRVGIVGNQTSIVFKKVGYTHLVDTLITRNVSVVKVFAPEHGFRGTADAGESIKDAKDIKTGLPIISLYGDNKKPSAAKLEDVDILLFDIQDVGARFYTYISTLHYVMEACAEQNIPLVVLDRPNPNGHYSDGPILEKQHASFVGMHPVPVVHGMTIGEYAQMINGQGWLTNSTKADLTVIPIENYTKNLPYGLPVKPSPNLPNVQSINLYPSLCFFEGTNVNAGRGTDKQFQVFGSPFLNAELYPYTYTPQPNDGSKYPKHEGKRCYGKNLSENTKRLNSLHLEFLIDAYKHTADKTKFFNSFFTKLAGTEKLQQQIEQGMTSEEISQTWTRGLEAYNTMRKPYELYKQR